MHVGMNVRKYVSCVDEKNVQANQLNYKLDACSDFFLIMCCFDENDLFFNEMEAGYKQGILLIECQVDKKNSSLIELEAEGMHTRILCQVDCVVLMKIIIPSI